ncbi:MAG: aminopeptidase P family protein [Candidatus Dormibacteraeota bacterium]|nr:aminopeptidase P family protein [Candidatus Dormibacteraeota bacterium]
MAETAPILLFGETYHHPNILYRTGFLAPDPVVFVDRGGDDTVLWVSALEEGRARKQARAGEVRCTATLGLADKVRATGSEQGAWSLLVESICREHDLSAVTVDADFPVTLADHLRQQDIAVHPSLELYRRERRIKTPEEVELLAATENAGMEGLQRAIDVIAAAEIRDGILYRDGTPLTGADLAYVVESRILELGCTTEDSICCGGPENADPHRATSEVIRAGLPVVLDIYPYDKASRYWGDMTRTVVRGEPPAEVERMWEAVLAAQQAGLDAVKPGVNGRDVHLACCETFKKHGFGSITKPYDQIASDARFIHGTGHGVGLEIHEYPRIGDVDVTLEVGDVVTVEPGLYDPRFGGIRIEDLIVVTEDGHRNLTTLPKVFHLDR